MQLNPLTPKNKLKIRVKLTKLRHRTRTDQRALTRLVSRFRRQLVAVVSILGVVIVAFTVFFGSVSTAGAVVLSLGSDDIRSGVAPYAQIDRSNNALQLQNGSAGAWNDATGLQNVPTQVNGTSDLVYGPNNTLFLVTAFASQCHFYRYDIDQQVWSNLVTPPVGCGTGNNLVWDGESSLYYTPGNGSQRFFRYDIGNDSWSERALAPSPLGDFSAAQFVQQGASQYVYVFRGQGSASFFRYTVATNTWDLRADFPTSSNVNSGVSLAWDGNDKIYALSNGVGEFKAYTVSTDTWTDLGNISNTCNNGGLTFAGTRVISIRVQTCNKRESANAYDVSSGTWGALPAPPAPANSEGYAPPVAYDGSQYVYTLLGSDSQPQLFRFDTGTNSWDSPSLFNSSADDTAYHQQLMYDGSGAAYYVGGTASDSTDRVYKYDLTTKSATQVASQIGTTTGSIGAYSGGYLYLMGSSGSNTFERYNVGTSTWSAMASAPFNSAGGAAIVDGGDGYLYAEFGNSTSWYRYNIAGNTWGALTSMPQATGAGASVSRIGNKFYVLCGGQTPYFYVYDKTIPSWSAIQAVPSGVVANGSFLAGDGSRYLYLGLNSQTDATARNVYQYDTTGASWLRIADLPAVAKAGASAFYDVGNNKLYVAQGSNSAAIWNWVPNGALYAASGTWYSKPYDLKAVVSWSSLNANITGSGSTVISTRSSPDGHVWTNWQALTGTTINSPVHRYLQFNVALSGGGTTTPIVSNMSIHATQSTTPAALPTGFTAFDNLGGAAISSGQSYTFLHPYFAWQASDDGTDGPGVAGYDVYFGTDSSADPATLGSFQTGTDYTVTTPMTAGTTYYIRIKVQDNLGNVSSAGTYFSYTYNYISPPSAAVETSTADFNAGSNSNLTVANGSMTLVQQANGSWSTGPMSMLPATVNGPAEAVVGNSLYVARGASSNVFWRYNMDTQSWSTLAAVPNTVNPGSAMAYDGTNFLYLLRGGGNTGFYKYDISGNTWTTLSTLPSGAQQGSDITSLGNNKFAVLLTGVRAFYVYDTTANTFTAKAGYPTSISDGGSGIWYDGQDSVYAYLGAWGSTERTRSAMVKYSISSNSWSTLADPPVITTYDQNNLVSDGKGGLYVFTTNTSDDLNANQRTMRYDIGSDSWSEVHGLSAQTNGGSATSDGQRFIYVLPSSGSSSLKIVRLDTNSNAFSPTGNFDSQDQIPNTSHTNALPWIGGNATTATYDGSQYIYAIAGAEGNTSSFLKYDPNTGTTKYFPAPPSVGTGGSLAYLNGSVYYLKGNTTSEFYKFDETAAQWLRMGDLPVNAYRPGTSSLVATSTDLYAPQGNSNKFYRYTPDAGLGSWTAMANAPGTILNAASVYDSANGYVYVVAGNNTASVYRYNIASNTWTTLSSMPGTTSYGATIVLHGGKLYVERGNTTTTTYVYDVGSNSWSTGTDAPDTFNAGATAIDMGNYSLNISGEASPDFWQFNYPTATTAFNGQGIHQSATIPTAGAYGYANVSASGTFPANTSVDFWTRTSIDGTTWSNWQAATGVKQFSNEVDANVASPVNRFMQVKIALSSLNNVNSPQIDSYTVNYYADTTPPTNPTQLSAYTDITKSTPLNNNAWYNYATPDFDWPDAGSPGGADDGGSGSGIAGYWVYVGTDNTAVPRTAGTFVTASEYSPALTAPGTYYVLIQAQDAAGNVDGSVFSPFTYKFDNETPSNPTVIAATPAGYTNTNSYSFSWSGANDLYSGIASYCYHSGATSGAFSSDICQSGTTLTNLPIAYQNGANVLYVKAMDNAGNSAPTYTTITFYYSTQAPGSVQNLRAVPPTSTTNMFAFAWDPPAVFAGDPNKLTYCYSINVLPTALNTTCTTDRSLAAFKAATQHGTNTLYMVAKDEANDVDWTNFASAVFIANTVSPGIPLNVVASDTSDRSSSRWSITTTWNAPQAVGNGIAAYIVERSTDGNSWTQLGQTSSRAFVDLDVQPNVPYYYRISAADNVGNAGGPSGAVTATAQGSYSSAPGIVVAPSASADANQARINWATERPATTFVQWGTSPSALTSNSGTLDLVTSHSQTLTGLQPSTTYFYRVQSFDTDRTYDTSAAVSQVYSFRTGDIARITNVTTDGVTLNSASISWSTTVASSSRVEFGRSLQFGSSQDDSGTSTQHTMHLSNLAPGTKYYYRIDATTAYGSTIYSDYYQLITNPQPTVSNVRFQSTNDGASTGVEVTWDTSVATSSTVKYSGLGQSLEVSQSELVTQHSVKIDNLASSATYTFVVSGRDNLGNLAQSEPQNWTSGVDTRAPVVSHVSMVVSTVQGKKGPEAQLIVQWKTDEPATGQVHYGTYSGKKLDKESPLITEQTTDHIAIISGLNLADIYQVQIESKDPSGNVVFGVNTMVVTPDNQPSLLNGTLDFLTRIFRL